MRAAPTLAILVAIGTLALGQSKPHTPKVGSPERKAILDAVRPHVGKQLGSKKVVFVPQDFRVLGNWAFLFGEPREANGKPLNLKGTQFEQLAKDGVWDPNVSALLKKSNGKWTVLACVVGATDVPWVEWPQKYKAPKAIFPL